MDYFASMGDLKRTEVLQNIDEYRKTFRARRAIQNKISSLEHFYSSLTLDTDDSSLEYILAEFESIKNMFTDEENILILRAIPRKNSPDKRKNERWKRHLSVIQQIIQTHKDQISPQNTIDSKANELLGFLTNIFANGFEDQFFTSQIQERIFDLRNNLIKYADNPEMYKKITLDLLGKIDVLFSLYTREIRNTWEKLTSLETPIEVYVTQYLEP